MIIEYAVDSIVRYPFVESLLNCEISRWFAILVTSACKYIVMSEHAVAVTTDYPQQMGLYPETVGLLFRGAWAMRPYLRGLANENLDITTR